MIWNGIISAIVSGLNAILSLFPIADATVISSLSNSVASFKTAIASADYLFPVSEFFTIMTIVISIEAGILLIKIIHWLAKNISAGFIK